MYCMQTQTVPIEDHTLDAVWEFTNFSNWHVIPDIPNIHKKIFELITFP